MKFDESPGASSTGRKTRQQSIATTWIYCTFIVLIGCATNNEEHEGRTDQTITVKGTVIKKGWSVERVLKLIGKPDFEFVNDEGTICFLYNSSGGDTICLYFRAIADKRKFAKPDRRESAILDEFYVAGPY